MTTREVVLDGGSPWGFRLHGGADLNQPLRISRVNPGSKAALRGIREGDFITSINNQSTRNLSISQAHSLLRNSGNTIKLGLNEECGGGGSPKRRQYKTVHQETTSETVKKSSITSYTLTSSKTVSVDQDRPSNINGNTNGNYNNHPRPPVDSQRSTLSSSGSSTPSGEAMADNGRSRRRRNQRKKAMKSIAVVVEEQQYQVESPKRTKSPERRKPVKSRSLDDDDHVKIQEVTEGSENEDKSDCKVIVSEAESDPGEDPEPESGPPRSLSLQVEQYTSEQTALLSPEEELTLRNFLEGLNLVNSPEDAFRQVRETSTMESVKSRRARKRAALEQYFNPITQNPRFLDVISEETSDLSDREQQFLTKHLKQGTPEPEIPVRRRMGTPILLGTKIISTPVTRQVCSSSEAEVVFLEDSSNSSSPDPNSEHEDEKDDLFSSNNSSVPDLRESETVEETKKIKLNQKKLETDDVKLEISELTPPPTPDSGAESSVREEFDLVAKNDDIESETKCFDDKISNSDSSLKEFSEKLCSRSEATSISVEIPRNSDDVNYLELSESAEDIAEEGKTADYLAGLEIETVNVKNVGERGEEIENIKSEPQIKSLDTLIEQKTEETNKNTERDEEAEKEDVNVMQKIETQDITLAESETENNAEREMDNTSKIESEENIIVPETEIVNLKNNSDKGQERKVEHSTSQTNTQDTVFDPEIEEIASKNSTIREEERGDTNSTTKVEKENILDVSETVKIENKTFTANDPISIISRTNEEEISVEKSNVQSLLKRFSSFDKEISMSQDLVSNSEIATKEEETLKSKYSSNVSSKESAKNFTEKSSESASDSSTSTSNSEITKKIFSKLINGGEVFNNSCSKTSTEKKVREENRNSQNIVKKYLIRTVPIVIEEYRSPTIQNIPSELQTKEKTSPETPLKNSSPKEKQEPPVIKNIPIQVESHKLEKSSEISSGKTVTTEYGTSKNEENKKVEIAIVRNIPIELETPVEKNNTEPPKNMTITITENERETNKNQQEIKSKPVVTNIPIKIETNENEKDKVQVIRNVPIKIETRNEEKSKEVTLTRNIPIQIESTDEKITKNEEIITPQLHEKDKIAVFKNVPIKIDTKNEETQIVRHVPINIESNKEEETMNEDKTKKLSIVTNIPIKIENIEDKLVSRNEPIKIDAINKENDIKIPIVRNIPINIEPSKEEGTRNEEKEKNTPIIKNIPIRIEYTEEEKNKESSVKNIRIEMEEKCLEEPTVRNIPINIEPDEENKVKTCKNEESFGENIFFTKEQNNKEVKEREEIIKEIPVVRNVPIKIESNEEEQRKEEKIEETPVFKNIPIQLEENEKISVVRNIPIKLESKEQTSRSSKDKEVENICGLPASLITSNVLNPPNPSPTPSLSSGSSSRATSLCTAKYNSLSGSIGDINSIDDFAKTGTKLQSPITLRELCVELLMSIPFGADMLQELADVSSSIHHLTNNLLSAANLPGFMSKTHPKSSVQLPATRWVGLASETDPRLLVCLSPTQRSQLDKSRRVEDEAAKLLDLHEKFIFRTSHGDGFERHAKNDVEITSIKADGVSNRLLAIIRDAEETPMKISTDMTSGERLRAKDLDEWLHHVRNNERRASLPHDFYAQQMIHLQEKEREIQRELEMLEEEKRKLTAEMGIRRGVFRPEDYHISKKGDFAENKRSRPASVATEFFRQQMYEEYLGKIAAMEERKQQKVIKVTQLEGSSDTKAVSGIKDEFMDKVKEKQKLGKLLRDEESQSDEADQLPKHLQEFMDITQQSENRDDGVWSPGQKQDSRPLERERSHSDAKDEPLSPIWSPKSANSSPILERKEFRPIKYASPVLSRKQSIRNQEEPPWKIPETSSDTGIVLSSALDKRLPTSHSAPASGFSDFSTSRLPRAQNPTITLLQKAREGQLPKGALYIEDPNYKRVVPNERPPLVEPGEILYKIKNEYTSESDSERPRKMADLGPRKFEGIGPTTKDGMPLILRSEVKDANQSKWYKKMYDTIHKQKPHRDEYVTVKYKQRRGQYPYSSGYLSEPEPGAYDSDFTDYKYATLDRRRPQMRPNDHVATTSTMPRYAPPERNTGVIRHGHDTYKNQPGRIENYIPGHSSISEKEAREWWDEVMDIFDGHLEQQKRVPQTKSFMNQALKESGYESDSTLVFRRRDDTAQQLSPLEQKEAYKIIQKGGDVPLHGLRKPAPERPKESPRKYVENEVTIHYKTPVRQEIKEYLSEDELAYRQAEAMKKIYQEERRRKYLQVSKSLQELQDMNSRRHTDNFIPSQKSPISLNRYDDFDDLSPPVKPRPRSPEPRLLARALYNFVGQTARELTFRKGDLIYVRRQVDKNWYEGELNAMVGLFPVNYVEIVTYDTAKTTPRKSHEGQARAKYNFVAQTHLELSLAKGELVVVTRRVDDNWFEGKIGGRKGIFPVSYVEVLVDPSDPPVPSTKPVAAPASHSLLLNGSAGGKESMGSHSYTPTMTANQLTTSYKAKPVQTTGGSYGSLNRTSKNPVSQALHIETQSEPVPYRALYKYLPQNDDELELLEGDTVFVLEKCDDGWYVGSSERTGAFGTFPGNYVEKI